MDEIVYREMRPADVPQALALRNQVFADYPITADDWAGDGMRAAIAVLDGAVVGAIPLVMRELVIAPGVVVRAPFENSVGTKAELRSRGVGAGMIAAARSFLHSEADGLFVYRSDERSQGYRFYVKSGHHHLVATRAYQLVQPQAGPLPDDALATGGAAICAEEEAMLALFQSAYGLFGGYPQRRCGYWQRAMASSVFAEAPTNFYGIWLRQGTSLLGYALVGVRSRWEQRDEQAHILELAILGADLHGATRLLALVAAFAAAQNLVVTATLSDDDPFVPAVLAAGYTASARSHFLMGQVLDAPGFFERYWRDRFPSNGVGIRVTTPTRDEALRVAASGMPTISLEMKEETLHRWLLARADLAARLREGSVTAYGAPIALVQQICRMLPCTPWVYHKLDDI